MNKPFTNHNKINLRRLLCLIAVLALLTTLFAGCSKKKEDPDPSSEDSMLDLPENTSAVTDPSTEPEETTDPSAEELEELMKIRSAPSMDATPLGTLQPGTEIHILREEEVNYVRWALIREGWICIEKLEKYQGPDGIIIGGSGENETTATEPQGTTAPTTGNGNGGTGNTGNTGNGNTGTGTTTNTPGIVIASELNIRESADMGSNKLGMYTYGTRVVILETKDGWGRTDKGWVSMEYIYKDGTPGPDSCKGVVIGNGLNVRSGPGTNYDKVGTMNTGDRAIILARFQYGNTWWGCTEDGWISMDYVYVDGTTGEGEGHGTVIGEDVNVRSGPGTQYDLAGKLNYGENVEILFQITINGTPWGCFGTGKWVCMDYVGMG